MAVSIAVAMLLRPISINHRAWIRHLSRHMPLLALAMSSPIVTAVLPFGLLSAWNQMLQTYLRSRSAYDVRLGENAAKLSQYLAENNWGLVPPACVGLLALYRRHRAEAGSVAAWETSLAISMLGHSPLMDHHLFLLHVPTALLAAMGLWELARLGQGLAGGRRLLLLAASGLGLNPISRAFPRCWM
jgi:hypothetical protein